MSPIPLTMLMLLYATITTQFYLRDDYPMAFVWLCYTGSGLGFLWYSTKGG